MFEFYSEHSNSFIHFNCYNIVKDFSQYYQFLKTDFVSEPESRKGKNKEMCQSHLNCLKILS